MHNVFVKFANKASKAVGSPWAFVIALLVLVVWAASGPLLGFSDTWQLVINTSTTIITFLIVFLIQNTQNRDSQAINLKLNELIKSAKGARSTLIDLEELSDEEFKKLQREYRKLAKKKITIK